MDKCSDEEFLNKKRERSEDNDHKVNIPHMPINEGNKINNEVKINESKNDQNMNNIKMMKILKTIESRNKSNESCILCSKKDNIYSICSIQEYVYLCKYLYMTDEIRNSYNYKQSFENFLITFNQHQDENIKDFNYIKSVCRPCLVENLKTIKGFDIVYYMLVNKNFKNNFVKKEKQDNINNIIEILNSVKTPSIPDFSTLFNNTDDIEKTIEDVKKKFFNLQYDNLLQKLFLSYLLGNLETFLSQLTKTQVLCENIMNNMTGNDLLEKLFLLKNIYNHGGNLINELASNMSQLKENANKIFRNELKDINDSINSNNINNVVNTGSSMNTGDFGNPVYSYVNYLSPELNTNLLFNQLASNYNQMFRVRYT